MRLRQKLIDERGRLELTQEEVAAKAGVRQGLVSRWEDLSVEITDPSARVLFQIVERAFGKTLTEFFSEIEHADRGAQPADNPAHLEARAHADSLSSAISRSDLEQFARALGRSIGHALRAPAPARRPAKARARRAHRR